MAGRRAGFVISWKRRLLDRVEGFGEFGVTHGVVVADETLLVEVFQALVHGHHSGVVVGLEEAVELFVLGVSDDVSCADCGEEDFCGDDAAAISGDGQELLGDDGLEGVCELHSDLGLLVWGEDVDDSIYGLYGVGGVNCSEHKVAGFGGGEGGGNCFEVAHFADDDDVGILAEDMSEGIGEAAGVAGDFALLYDRSPIAVDELNGVFYGDDHAVLFVVYLINHGGEGGGFAAAGGAGDEDEAAIAAGDFLDDGGEPEFFQGADFGVYNAECGFDGPALFVDVDAEASDIFDFDAEV